MKAKYISGSGGEGTAAVIEIDGVEYECMNCLGFGRSRGYRPGDIIFVSLIADRVKTDARGNVQIDPNPQQRKALESRGGWRYRAYGIVTTVTPSKERYSDFRALTPNNLDCGAVNFAVPQLTGDDLDGRFIAIDIERMDCWRSRNRAESQRKKR